MKLLIVEDARDLNLLLVKMLTKAGYSVDSCCNGAEALDCFLGSDYDGMVCDIMMPEMDGYTLLRTLRNQGKTLPVLFLTARDSVEDRVAGLDMGACDYVVKPFHMEELLARIRVMLRQSRPAGSSVLRVADLSLDSAKRKVFRGTQEISLLPKEFAILEYLMHNEGIVLSREQLENQIWNYSYSGSSNSVDVYLSHLRKKIDSGFSPRLIHTIRRVGWVLRVEEDGSR